MTRRKSGEYIFADAYIGSFVKNLMSEKDLMRVVSCKNLDEAESILQEYGYGDAKELHEGDVEAFIRREQNKHFDLIYDTLPDRKELALFLFPYDYHNVKVCLKAEFMGITPNDTYLVSTGDIDWMRVVAMVRDRNYVFMSIHMKNAIIEATDLFSRGGDSQEIDIILDKACYQEMIETAERSKEDFLIEIVRLQIDTMNLKTFVRLRQIEKPWTLFQKVFIEGGNISQQFYISTYEEPFTQVAEKLEPYRFKYAMEMGGANLIKTGDFNLFEKLCEDVVMKYIKRAKYEAFGIIPIAGYWYAKEIEIDNLRIILTGKLIGSSSKEIIERLRETYV